jgi:DNA-binding FadR family transcriptional regulator
LRHLFDLLYLKYSGRLLFTTARDTVGAQHRAIFQAVISQELNEARQALHDHFREVKSQALKSLGRIIAGELS